MPLTDDGAFTLSPHKAEKQLCLLLQIPVKPKYWLGNLKKNSYN